MEKRLLFIGGAFWLGVAILIGRFFQLQVLEYRTYKVLASDQHEIQAALVPKRGTIYLKDRFDGSLHPIAQDHDTWQVYAVMREVKDPVQTAKDAAAILGVPETDLMPKFTSPTSTYFVLSKDVPLAVVDAFNAKRLPGIGVTKGQSRLYPEEGIGGQFIGFVVNDEKNQRVGKYGIEGFEQDLLAGEPGTLLAEKDAAGRRLAIGDVQLKDARDGSDIVLTIDRTIQYTACAKVKEAVERNQAEGGSVIVLDPKTGDVLAMCSYPDFEPSAYGKIDDVGVLNNPAIFYQYEPGSVFKPFTIAAGLDAGKITPQTTYNDTGEEKIDTFTIHNSDRLGHGVQTMTQVLEKSLNTGTIFVQRQLGQDVFKDYVRRFGFGTKTGIELNKEVAGDVSPLSRKGKVYAATASYGQGITATPIQVAAGFAALGNGGKLMRPHVIADVIRPDGTHEPTKPEIIRQVISPRASRLVSAMMVDVVENGHGKKAGVPGYYVAGKTGTAQVPDPHGSGYLKDLSIGSFGGYAPADNPKFVMLVKIDRPKNLQFAEVVAAPLFGEMAKFLLTYLQVPTERPIVEKPSTPLPALSTSTPPVVLPPTQKSSETFPVTTTH